MIFLVSTGPDARALELMFRAGALFCGLKERVERMEALIDVGLEDCLRRELPSAQ